MGVQQTMWRYSSPHDLLSMARALSVITAIFYATAFFTQSFDQTPRSLPIVFWLVALAGLWSARVLYTSFIRSHARRFGRKTSDPVYRLLIQADLETSSTIIQTINFQTKHRFQIVGVVCEGAERGRTLLGQEVLGLPEQLPHILPTLDVAGCYPHAVVVGPSGSTSLAELTPHLERADAQLPILASTDLERHFSDIDQDTFLPKAFATLSARTPYGAVKRALDLAIALTALIFLAPILALVALAIVFFDGLPVFFTQFRAGQGLREFRLYKFRTMRPPLDRAGKLLAEVDRVTWLGNALRATRIDELPQLWNVLKGDMSIVGPRPLLQRDMPRETATLAERYSIRPGITGWAQVNGGKKIDNNDKMPLDIYYVRNCSLWIDFKIMLLTIKTVMFGEEVNQDHITMAKSNKTRRSTI
jgi:lipopolysaccharide/colanic/teichoic acid biosynthesis glycosyltransferase